MRLSSFLVVTAAAAIFASTAPAQEHPCVHPRDAFAAALCVDPDLHALAEQQLAAMVALWKRVSPQEQDKLRNEQLAWRDRTAHECQVDQPTALPLSAGTKRCLEAAETKRTQYLQHYDDTAAPTALHPNAIPQVTSPASVAVTDEHGAATYQDGLRDRAEWEQWFNSLQGDNKTGAFFWSSQRSLRHPGSCQQMNGDFYAGCTQAQIKLSRSDILRKTEPNYKAGWNAWAPSEPSGAPLVQNVPPAVAPPVARGASPAPSNPVYEYKPSTTESNPDVTARTQETTTTTGEDLKTHNEDNLTYLDDCLAKTAAKQPPGRPPGLLLKDMMSECMITFGAALSSLQKLGKTEEEADRELYYNHLLIYIARAHPQF
jgi:hypothetical protein